MPEKGDNVLKTTSTTFVTHQHPPRYSIPTLRISLKVVSYQILDDCFLLIFTHAHTRTRSVRAQTYQCGTHTPQRYLHGNIQILQRFVFSSGYCNIHLPVQMINSWSTSDESARPHVCTKDSKMLMLCALAFVCMTAKVRKTYPL